MQRFKFSSYLLFKTYKIQASQQTTFLNSFKFRLQQHRRRPNSTTTQNAKQLRHLSKLISPPPSLSLSRRKDTRVPKSNFRVEFNQIPGLRASANLIMRSVLSRKLSLSPPLAFDIYAPAIAREKRRLILRVVRNFSGASFRVYRSRLAQTVFSQPADDDVGRT